MDDLQKSLMREMIREELSALLPGALAEAVKAVKTRPSRAKMPPTDLTPLWAELETRLMGMETRAADHLRDLKPEVPDLAPLFAAGEQRQAELAAQVERILEEARQQIAALTTAQSEGLALLAPDLTRRMNATAEEMRAALDRRMDVIEGQAQNLVNATESRISQHLAALAIVGKGTE